MFARVYFLTRATWFDFETGWRAAPVACLRTLILKPLAHVPLNVHQARPGCVYENPDTVPTFDPAGVAKISTCESFLPIFDPSGVGIQLLVRAPQLARAFCAIRRFSFFCTHRGRCFRPGSTRAHQPPLNHQGYSAGARPPAPMFARV